MSAGWDGSKGKVWERQEEEPGYWYERFKLYLGLGAGRTVKLAFRRFKHKETGAVNVGHAWFDAARRWNWRGRADAWDLEQRSLLGLSERNLKLAAREKRVAWLEEWVENLREALHTADVANLSQAEARQYLGTLTKAFDTAVSAIHREYDKDLGEETAGGVTITADDLRAAQREMQRQDAEARAVHRVEDEADAASTADNGGAVAQDEHGASTRAGTHTPLGRGVQNWKKYTARRRVVFCYGASGDDPFDLSTLWAGGIGYVRVREVLSSKFAATIKREHALGRTVEWLHIALPTAVHGIVFANAARDGGWLARHLRGVRVLLLAQHTGVEAADWFDAVESVVTVDERMDADAARVFVAQFWQAIGQGRSASVALEQALAQCPVGTEGFVHGYMAEVVEEE